MYVSQYLTKKFQYQNTLQESAEMNSMKLMMLTMPLMTMFITFGFASAIGIYWIFRTILSMIQQYILFKAMPYPTFTEEEYKQAENSLNNIMKAVEQGIVNNTTNKRMKELENQIEDIDRQILIEKSKNAFKVSKQALKEFFIEALKLEPKLLIDYAIKEIRVYEDKLEIIFNSPIKRSPDTNQGFFLFTFNSKLPQYIQNKEIPNMLEMEIKYYV
jgi:hypothetical protein